MSDDKQTDKKDTPQKPENENEPVELNEADLEQVTGGVNPTRNPKSPFDPQ